MFRANGDAGHAQTLQLADLLTRYGADKALSCSVSCNRMVNRGVGRLAKRKRFLVQGMLQMLNQGSG